MRTVKWLRSLRTMLFAIIKSISCLLWDPSQRSQGGWNFLIPFGPLQKAQVVMCSWIFVGMFKGELRFQRMKRLEAWCYVTKYDMTEDILSLQHLKTLICRWFFLQTTSSKNEGLALKTLAGLVQPSKNPNDKSATGRRFHSLHAMHFILASNKVHIQGLNVIKTMLV